MILIEKKNNTSVNTWLVNLKGFERLRDWFLIDQSDGVMFFLSIKIMQHWTVEQIFFSWIFQLKLN